MKALISLEDLPEGGIGFSVESQKQDQDSGITDAGFLVQQLQETLQRIAVDMRAVKHPQLDLQQAQAFIRRAYPVKGEPL